MLLRSLTPHSVVGPTGRAHLSLTGQQLAAFGETALFYGVLACAAICATLLMACCIWDAMAHWRHWAHFRACERKVRRANEVLSKRKGELPLCPFCVEPISGQPSPSKVVFLCGHRFHTDCCNEWFLESPAAAGRCPICEDGAPVQRQSKDGAAGSPVAEDGDSANDGCNDEAQSFILLSLHKQFPEIISEACVKRWSSCHTQIWLSELNCPRYNSILHKHR